MIDRDTFLKTPMGKALQELSEQLQNTKMPPVSLNVIGGFALMLREVRSADDTTDIDYVGKNLPESFDKIADEIGVKHQLGRGWINNDVMLSGISLEDFEFATGKLHFDPAFQIGNIQINVLDETDLLRMKLIAVDTSLTSVEMGGDFSRAKDLADIDALLTRQGKTPARAQKEYKEFLICPYLEQVLTTYRTSGISGVNRIIDQKQSQYMRDLQKSRTEPETRSPYLEKLLDDLMAADTDSLSLS